MSALVEATFSSVYPVVKKNPSPQGTQRDTGEKHSEVMPFPKPIYDTS
jgi:hypothetical protein